MVNRITTLLGDASPAVVAAFIGDEVLEAAAGAKSQAERDEVLVEAYEHKRDEIQDEGVVLAARVEEIQARLEDSEAAAEEETARLKDALEHARGEIARLKGQHGVERKRGVALAASLATVATLITLAIVGSLPIGVPVLAGGLTLAIVLAPVVDNSRWAARVGFVLAVLGTLLSVVGLIK